MYITKYFFQKAYTSFCETVTALLELWALSILAYDI